MKYSYKKNTSNPQSPITLKQRIKKVSYQIPRLATETASLTDDIEDEEAIDRMALALDALSAYRQLCARLTRGLHAERAAAATAPAAPHAPAAPAARALRARHRYALRCAVQVGSMYL